MYQFRDIVSQGAINLGTRTIFVRGHTVSGRPVTLPSKHGKNLYCLIHSSRFSLSFSSLVVIGEEEKRLEMFKKLTSKQQLYNIQVHIL